MDIASITAGALPAVAAEPSSASGGPRVPNLSIPSFDKLAAKSLDGIFISPKMTYDSDLGKTILIYRDFETGAELKRYPASSNELASYAKAESSSSEAEEPKVFEDA